MSCQDFSSFLTICWVAAQNLGWFSSRFSLPIFLAAKSPSLSERAIGTRAERFVPWTLFERTKRERGGGEREQPKENKKKKMVCDAEVCQIDDAGARPRGLPPSISTLIPAHKWLFRSSYMAYNRDNMGDCGDLYLFAS